MRSIPDFRWRPRTVGRPATAAVMLFALAVCALGLRGMLTGLPIPAWQPVAQATSASILFRLDGCLLFGLGVLTMIRQGRRRGGYGLATLLFLWIAVLQSGPLLRNPASVALWLGAAEVGAILAAAILLARSGRPDEDGRDRAANAAHVLFGACAIVFGLSHFAYAAFTATMVPAWLPWRLGWAYATGLGHLAAGDAIISGVMPRLAAGLLTAMMASFVLLVHVPAVIASRGSLTELTFLFNACALCGSAWVVASTASRHPRAARDHHARGELS